MAVDAKDVWKGQEWTLFYTETATFQSGNQGAEARLSFELNNRGHHIYGITFSTFYEIPQALEGLLLADGSYPNLAIRKRFRDGGLDTAYTAKIELSQSNVATQPAPVSNIDSLDGTVRMYWPVPLRLRGGNNITVDMRRLLSYPTLSFGDPVQEFQPLPTVHATLKTGQFLTDQFPAGPPGSTGIAP